MSGGAEFQFVPPPLPQPTAFRTDSDDTVDTAPIVVIPDVIGPLRYHLYDLFVRLASFRAWPRWYKPLIVTGTIGLIVVSVASIDTHFPWVTIGLAVLFTLIFSYPLVREVYGWMKRRYTITTIRNGIRIDIEEPQNLLFFYVVKGSFDIIEGSLRIEDKRRFVNKIFRGSGTITIFDKVENEEKGRLVNIRRFDDVYDFLSQSVGR